MAHCQTNRAEPGRRSEEREESDTSDNGAPDEANIVVETEDQLQDLRLTGQETKRAREPMPISRDRLSETGLAFNRFAKRLLSGVILLPMDFTLSLSRGFHNAPKLYHDRMVKATRKVVGIRSGFKAAGEVCPQSHQLHIHQLTQQPRNSAAVSIKA